LEFEDGKDVLLRDDPDSFADACVELLREKPLCVRLGQAARAKAMELYDRQNMIQREMFGSLTPVRTD
jgi:glycosyltransferase involved in cell wall biosynthesis